MIAVKSATKGVKIDEVEESIFSSRYFARCLDCLFCQDSCCSCGCQMDRAERDRILIYAPELEARLGISASQWFKEIIKDADYPSGESVRTKVYGDRCVFYDHRLRGCWLHRFAVEKGMDHHLLKPMVCCLFPVAWEKGCLFVSGFLDEMPCKDQGVPVFQAQKEELRFYFGGEFVSELEAFYMTFQNWGQNPLT